MSEKKIFIVDDDMSVRDALHTVFELDGYEAVLYDSGSAFLENRRIHGEHPILLDVHMPGRSGIDVLSALEPSKYNAPIFIISGQGDIPMAVNAIKSGAYDFIEKPFDGNQILGRVEDAIEKFRNSSDTEVLSFEGSETLTPREMEVLKLIADGQSNKEAGRDLGISPRTVEVHRARIMEKLGAKNAADLVRIVLKG